VALTDDITAWSTAGAVVAALGIAAWGNRRSDRQTAQERERADRQLREERERSDRQRRIERNVDLLVEVYDLYAEYKSTAGGRRDDAALFKLRARLAVLPWTVATLIRFDISEELLNDPDAKKAWVAHRAGRTGVKIGEVGFELLKHEFPADLWFLRSDQPFDGKRQWWFAYDQEYPPIGGHVSPGVVAPKLSAI
jgi:hypothetical protein